jgi:uncharacterized HAD superfamily protein
MQKKTIAVDIDDVLAVHGEAMIAYSNRVFGTNLTIDDYTEHWSEMWKVDHAETERRAIQYHQTDDMASYRHHADALPVLKELAQKYRLIIVTARRRDVSGITATWIDKYFGGIFESINYAGIWDKIDEDSATATKAELCKELGVDYLIDDQSKHCNGAAEVGITAIMFGDYPWTRDDKLHTDVIRCHTWEQVGDFFRARE